MLENFAAMEIVKLASWAATDARRYHYRDGRDEVDLVLEARSGDLIAIEVKASATLDTGRQTIPLGDRLWALPISSLWRDG